MRFAPAVVAIAAAAVLPPPGSAVAEDEPLAEMRPPTTELELRMFARGLVDVRAYDPTIVCQLKYTDPANFTGEDMYGEVDQCFLLDEAARRLAVAHDELKKERPDLHFVVADGLRPREVQRRMWAIVRGTPQQPYVANPDPGSMHNHGAAVDLTIADEDGCRLDMGTPIDHFGPLAQPRLERHYLETGELTPEQVANRLLLRTAMTRAGFRVLQIEWWHFNAWDTTYVRMHFPIIESFGLQPGP